MTTTLNETLPMILSGVKPADWKPLAFGGSIEICARWRRYNAPETTNPAVLPVSQTKLDLAGPHGVSSSALMNGGGGLPHSEPTTASEPGRPAPDMPPASAI